MKLEQLLFTTVMLEQLLILYKTTYLNELKVEEVEVLKSRLKKVTLDSKQYKNISKNIDYIIRKYNRRIKNCESSTSEFTGLFINANRDQDYTKEFIENSKDFMNEIVSLVFEETKDASPENPKYYKIGLFDESKSEILVKESGKTKTIKIKDYEEKESRKDI